MIDFSSNGFLLLLAVLGVSYWLQGREIRSQRRQLNYQNEKITNGMAANAALKVIIRELECIDGDCSMLADAHISMAHKSPLPVSLLCDTCRAKLKVNDL